MTLKPWKHGLFQCIKNIEVCLTSICTCDIIIAEVKQASNNYKEVCMGIKTFTLRLTDEQHQYLEKRSNELGITKNDYIRNLIMNDSFVDKQEKMMDEISEIKEMLKNLEK